MAAYVMASMEITDAEAFVAYAKQVPKTLEAHGGRYLARGDAGETVEGTWRPKQVVLLEFPDMAAAKAWYASGAYQDILPLRLDHSRTHFMTFVDGV